MSSNPENIGDRIMSAVLTRLNISKDGRVASHKDVYQVLVIKKTLETAMEFTPFISGEMYIEVVRATMDALELAYSEMKK